MKTLKQAGVLVLGVLFLAGAVFAAGSASTSWKRPGPCGASKAPIGTSFSTITTAPGYKLVQVMSLYEPWGLGIGVLGDYVLANSCGDGMVLGFRNGQTQDLADGFPNLEGGRMWGKCYFGTKYGGVYGLDGNGVVTTLADPYDPFVEVFALDVDHETGTVHCAITDEYDRIVYFCRWIPGHGGEPLFSEDIAPCLGLAIKGNYLYFSITQLGAGRLVHGSGPYRRRRDKACLWGWSP